MATLSLSEIRARAGSLGGQRTVQTYGKRYMRKIAAFGGHVTRSKYRREPCLLNDFAIVDRETGEVVALLSGRDPQDFNLPKFKPDSDALPY